MANKLNITRRDFLNGCALSLAAGTSLSPLEILALENPGAPYPPLLTGLRGSHPGSFEIAHAVARTGARYRRPDTPTDSIYDLVVVGGGLSGLAAAFLYRQRAGSDKRVLVLDNHDDFGGHAKRNEFVVDGETLIGYGGSQSIDTPAAYSPVSSQLLKDLGIEVERFYDYFDQSYFERRGSQPSIYFESEHYGQSKTLPNVLFDYRGSVDPAIVDDVIDQYPIDAAARRALRELIKDNRDYLAGKSTSEKLAILRSTSFSDFLRKHADMPASVVTLMRDVFKGLWGVGFDAVSAFEATQYGQPGTRGLGLPDDVLHGDGIDQPYIFHFPDGNASIARALVRELVPDCVDGPTMEALVTAKLDYSKLDDPGRRCRIRLNSTAVDVRHTRDKKLVDVTYVRKGKPERVQARHAVLACYNSIIPSICPEVSSRQEQAIRHAVKIPLVYLSVAVRNWHAWDKLGTHSVYVPNSNYMHSFGLDFPVSMGDYAFTSGPDGATILHGTFIPSTPDRGLSDKEQSIQGRRRLLEMSFDDHEALILSQLEGALGPGGFDAGRDLAGITVNRWPHGYAYEYNHLYEPDDFSPTNGPHLVGRAQIGRISIANSDSSAYAYVNGALDAADRAVAEQIQIGN